MPSNSPSSAEQIRADLSAVHTAKFGQRDDDALTALLESTAQAMAIVTAHGLSAYDAEPDFITGSSDKEQSA